MLVVFRVGPKGDQTLDVVDVIPRHKQKQIAERGLGKKAGRFFWVEVDDAGLSDAEFDTLARQITEPVTEDEQLAIGKHGMIKRRRLKHKRRYRLNQDELERLDPNFNAATSTRTHDASRVYPQVKLTVSQFRRIIRDKETGVHLDGH